ncbi:hypothetical protein AB0M35_28010 [Micromonospora sp. NPDC051196]|uniref:hypothetical protein n=1 Tax=Micromonospora sp. NPDC051196 TaxID=3155281 RepID=UPI003431E71F
MPSISLQLRPEIGEWPVAVGQAGAAGVLARDAYGFRNPTSNDYAPRTATTRRTRGHLNPR